MSVTELDLRSVQIDYDRLKHQIEQGVEQRYHWRWQRGFWVLTVVVAVCGAIIAWSAA